MPRLMILGVILSGTAPIDQVPDVLPPAPGDVAPTYPSHVPTPGAIVEDSDPTDEGTAVGTLSIQPSFALPYVIEFAESDEIVAEQGQETVYARGRVSRRGFTCTWRGVTEAEKDTVLSLLDETPFNWTPPGDAIGKFATATNVVAWTKTGACNVGPVDVEELR